MRPLNAQKFINEIQEIDWTNVSIETDAQVAYRKFHKMFSEKYISVFLHVKIKLYTMI